MMNMASKLFNAADRQQIPITIADPELPDCPLVYANGAFEKLTRYSSQDISGQNCRFLQGDDTDVDVVARLGNAIRLGEAHTCCLLNYRGNGEPFHNLLFVDSITVEPDRNYVVGCQFEVTKLVTQPGIAAQVANTWCAVTDLNLERTYRETVQMRREILQTKAETAIVMIRDYLMRTKLSGYALGI